MCLSACFGPVADTVVRHDLGTPEAYLGAKKLGHKTVRAHHRAGTLLITTPSAEPGYQRPEMAYQSADNRIQYFADHAWLAPPARLLSPLMAEVIQAQHAADSVVMAPSQVRSDWRLDTHVLYWRERVFCNHAEVEIGIRWVLLNSHTQAVVRQRTLFTHIPAPVGPQGLALASQELLREVVLRELLLML
jgi:cholesterol transport system auxiliary component